MNPGVFDYIEGDSTVFEQAPLRNLAKDGELMAVPPRGILEVHGYPARETAVRGDVQSGNAPWKIWE